MALGRLAWRNLWRHRTRTLLLVLVVAYVTLIAVFYFGYIDGFAISTEAAYARNILAPVRVASRAWLDEPDPENALPSLAAAGSLRTLPGVTAVAPRLEFPAFIRSAYLSDGVNARGVDPAAEGRVSAVPSKVESGRWLAERNEVVLGKGLAARLDARLGERIVLDASALAGARSLGFRVVGLARTRVPVVDDSLVMIGLDDARALTGVSTATTLDLDVVPGRESAVAREASILLPQGLSARGIHDLMGLIATDLDFHRVAGLTIGLILAGLAAFAVAGTVLVSVIERTREFGIVTALGMRPRQIALMVVLESMTATAIGAVTGLLLGYGLIAYLATHNVIGAAYASMSSSFENFAFGEEIYAAVRPEYALFALAIALLAGLLAALAPVRRVLRLKPTDGMRGD